MNVESWKGAYMNTGRWTLLFIVALLVSFTGFSQAQSGTIFKETVTPFPIPKGDAPDRMVALPSLTVSPDSQHIAYVARNNKKYFVVKDGIGQKPYDDIAKGSPIFSPDSQKVIYGGQKGNNWCIVSGTQEMKLYKNISRPLVSSDSKRLAYVASDSDKGKSFVVIDGKEERRQYDGVIMKPFSLIFSPDSSRFAYTAVKNKKMFLVCDGKESKAYDRIGSVNFSWDSKHIAFIAMDGTGKMFLVSDGVESEKHERIMLFLYSYDSKRLAYVAFDKNKWAVYVDGKPGPSFDNLSVPRFSPDSAKIAYTAAVKKDKMGLMVDHKQVGPDCDEFSYLMFSPDSAHVLVAAKKGAKWSIVTDGVEGQAYDAVAFPIFSPDYKHMAYVVKKEGREMIVHDGKEGPSYDGAISPIFSPDSQHILAVCKKKDKYVVVVDGKENMSYDLVSEPAFSPDSKHYAYMAKRDDRWFIVADGNEGKERFIGFIKESKLAFTSNNKFSALGIRPGPNFVKMEVDLGK